MNLFNMGDGFVHPSENLRVNGMLFEKDDTVVQGQPKLVSWSTSSGPRSLTLEKTFFYQDAMTYLVLA